MKITSLTNPLIKEVCLLKKNKERNKKSEFLLQGIDFLKPALNKHLVKMIFTIGEEEYEVNTIHVTKEILKKISIMENSFEPVFICAYLKNNINFGQKLVYLDGVQDPGNVGTIIRTALSFSYDGVILNEKCASIYSQKVLNASKGAIFDITLYQNIPLEKFKELGYQIILTTLQEAIDFKDIVLKDKFVVVFGSEGQGVNKKYYAISDKNVKIAIKGMDSLNVAVASGIILERYRR